jgi:hypothetical protein
VPEPTDDQLLDALGAALLAPGAAECEPTMREVMALRAAVDDATRASAKQRMTRWRRRVAVFLAGGVVLSGGTAYATSGSAPRPVRSAAFALKLPVESPNMTDAKKALAELEAELRDGRRDHVATALADAERELGELSPGARASLEPRASDLLAAARSFLERTADLASEARTEDRSGAESDDDRGTSGSGDPSERDWGPGGDDGGSGSGSSGSGSDDGRTSGSGTSGSGHGSDDGATSGSGSGTSGSGSDDGRTRDGSSTSGSSGSSDSSGFSSSGSLDD